MIKKTLIIFSLIILLTGCSAKNKPEEIAFSSWGSVSEVGIIKNAISNFEHENPDIKVKFIHIPQEYTRKIHLLFASNTEPDVIFINNLVLPVYESKLEDVSSFIKKDEYYNQAIDCMSYKGRLLAVPRDVSNQVFYINTDMVKLADNNTSMEELLAAAKNASKKGIFGFSSEGDIYWAIPYMNYFGGGIYDKEGNYIAESEASLEGINFYKDLQYKYKVAPTKSQIGSSTTAQMFLDKKIAIYLSGRWMYPKISEKADFGWKVITFPSGKSPQLCDASGWAIAKASKHKDAAIKFVKYMSDEKTSEYFAQTGLIVPARIQASEVLKNGNHNEKAFLAAIKISQSRTVSRDYKKITDKLNMKFDL